MTNMPSDHRMITFGLPDDQKLLAAFGSLTIRHGQLDYSLRMMTKTLGNVSITEALDATARQGSAELRKRILGLAKKKIGDGEALLKLQALLERSKQVSEKRNDFIHSLWAHELDGSPVIRQEDHSWKETPKTEELQDLANQILGIANELNQARLDGFISEALKKTS